MSRFTQWGVRVTKSLQGRIIFIIILFIFLPVLYLLNYNFSHSEIILQQKTLDLILDNLRQVGNQIENTCLDIIKISNTINADDTILSTLPAVYPESQGSSSNRKNIYTLSSREKMDMVKIESQLNYLKAGIFFNYNADVMIIDSNGMIYCAMDREQEFEFKIKYMDKYAEQQWFQDLFSGNQNIIWTAPFRYNIGNEGEKDRYISAVRTIKGRYPQEYMGIIMVNVNEEYFQTMLKDSVNGIVALINEDKEVIFSTEYGEPIEKFNFSEILSNISNESKGSIYYDSESFTHIINYYSLNRVGWNLISIVPYNDVMHEILNLKRKIFTVNIIAFSLLLVIVAASVVYITNPLKKLIDRIRRMKIGDYSVGIQREIVPDDVTSIVESFDYMFRRVDTLVKTVIEEQKREYELKYEMLQAQITPHFLLNTLNTIKWSAMMSGAGNVSRIISALGKLLEASIGKGDEEITFREEFDLIQSYIFIQNARYNDKYILTIEAEEPILNMKLPKLILQPLVENSVIHGLKNCKDKGNITIKAKRDGNMVRVAVIDDGEGITPERMRQIYDEAGREIKKHKFSGIGLINVDERLKIRYGKSYGIHISSQTGLNTSVTIVLPVIEFRGECIGELSDA